MRVKRMVMDEFRSVLDLRWVPAEIAENAIPVFLRGIPNDILYQVHASGCLPSRDQHSIFRDEIIGGIDVYRNAPEDPVKYNKDWYAIQWNLKDPANLLVVGPLRIKGDHWLNEVPKRTATIR